jgi:hypothetical protein
MELLDDIGNIGQIIIYAAMQSSKEYPIAHTVRQS